MKWTIGMPSYNNFTEVFFTIQSLRMHHDLTDCEIVIVDNYGDINLKQWIKQNGNGVVKYYKCNEIRGVSIAKNKIFEVALGEYVLVIDSHILIKPGVFNYLPPDGDLVHGPLLRANMEEYNTHWISKWGPYMWGVWSERIKKLPTEPFEIWGMGAGFFACKRDSWLGFNPKFRGFGGETGYIQEKYRKAGKKVWCYPNMIWTHLFYNEKEEINYPCNVLERVMNYLIGFNEINLDTEPIINHFGKEIVNKARARIKEMV